MKFNSICKKNATLLITLSLVSLVIFTLYGLSFHYDFTDEGLNYYISSQPFSFGKILYLANHNIVTNLVYSITSGDVFFTRVSLLFFFLGAGTICFRSLLPKSSKLNYIILSLISLNIFTIGYFPSLDYTTVTSLNFFIFFSLVEHVLKRKKINFMIIALLAMIATLQYYIKVTSAFMFCCFLFLIFINDKKVKELTFFIFFILIYSFILEVFTGSISSLFEMGLDFKNLSDKAGKSHSVLSFSRNISTTFKRIFDNGWYFCVYMIFINVLRLVKVKEVYLTVFTVILIPFIAFFVKDKAYDYLLISMLIGLTAHSLINLPIREKIKSLIVIVFTSIIHLGTNVLLVRYGSIMIIPIYYILVQNSKDKERFLLVQISLLVFLIIYIPSGIHNRLFVKYRRSPEGTINKIRCDVPTLKYIKIDKDQCRFLTNLNNEVDILNKTYLYLGLTDIPGVLSALRIKSLIPFSWVITGYAWSEEIFKKRISESVSLSREDQFVFLINGHGAKTKNYLKIFRELYRESENFKIVNLGNWYNYRNKTNYKYSLEGPYIRKNEVTKNKSEGGFFNQTTDNIVLNKY